jgi:hypothetical protein
MKYVVTLLLTLTLIGCAPDSHTAIRAISDMGFTNVNLGERDWVWSGCSESTPLNITFTATQPTTGRRVQGICCCDYLGTCSVRTR